jgi:hypothetical protein
VNADVGPDLRRLRDDFPYFCEAVLGRGLRALCAGVFSLLFSPGT